MTIPDHIRTFLGEPHYATVATIDADGGPRQATVWYRFEDDAIVLNSLAGRTWPNNLLRDGRVSIAVRAGGDGYQWVGLSGVAEPITDQADRPGRHRRDGRPLSRPRARGRPGQGRALRRRRNGSRSACRSRPSTSTWTDRARLVTRVVILAGGTGGAKLAAGFDAVAPAG